MLRKRDNSDTEIGGRGTRGHTPTAVEQLLSRIVVNHDTGCWVYIGPLVKGYGVVWLGRQQRPTSVYAHRLSYEYHVGPIPDGLVIDHLCRNKACVNPDHLDPCEQRENMRRWAILRTHCRHGEHQWVDENILVFPNGTRTCRLCREANLASQR